MKHCEQLRLGDAQLLVDFWEAKMTKVRHIGPRTAVAFMAALALTVAACGSDDDTSTSGSGTDAVTDSTAAPADTGAAADTAPASSAGEAGADTTAAPGDDAGAQGDKIVVSLSTDVNLLEQHLFRTTGSYAVTRALYQPLLDQEYAEEGGANIGSEKTVPSEILESYEVADDGTATFVLAEDAKFANGDAITADDAVYMLKRSIEAPESYIPLLLPFIAIDSSDAFAVVDDRTFTITPNVPTPLFERFMTFQVFGPLQKSLAEAEATTEDPFAFSYFSNNVNASGPYTLTSWDQAAGELVLDPNPGWPGEVANAGIIVRNVPDAAQRALLLKNGDIDVAAGLPPRLLDELGSDPNVKIFTAPSTRINYIALNAGVEPKLADKSVRQAISYAIPYQALIENVMYGFASPAGTLITSNMETYDAEGAGVYSTDIDKAKELMEKSGVGPFEVELAVQNSHPADQQAAVFIQDALRELEITVNINVLPDSEYADKQNGRELAMSFHEWKSWGDDPFYQLTFLAKCKAFTNFADGCNEDLDKLIAEGTFETDPARRAEIGLEAQKLMVEDADRIYLWSPDWNLATRADITGVTKDFTEVERFENLTR